MKDKFWYKPLFHRKIDGLKKKVVHVTIKPISAYDPNDFKLFSFEGWISLPINNRQIYFKRYKDPTYPWHFFSWKDIMKRNWKYNGPKKEDFIFNYWYVVKFNFVKKIVMVKELL